MTRTARREAGAGPGVFLKNFKVLLDKFSGQFQMINAMGKKNQRIGILTAGGDCPGLNAAIRGVGKSALNHGMEIVGFRDGFRGLVENRRLDLDKSTLAGILTVGGTILGTSRDKPHRMMMDGRVRDMTGVIKDNYKKWGLDCIVCLGGGGTAKNALRLKRAGLNVITLPKTIDNDVVMTDATFKSPVTSVMKTSWTAVALSNVETIVRWSLKAP